MSCCSVQSITKLHKMEDDVMRMPGLYTFWSILYVCCITCLSVDDTTGSSRDFLMILVALFPAFADLIKFMVINCLQYVRTNFSIFSGNF